MLSLLPDLEIFWILQDNEELRWHLLSSILMCLASSATLRPFPLSALVFGISHEFCPIHTSRISPNTTSFNKNIQSHLEQIKFISVFDFLNYFNC